MRWTVPTLVDTLYRNGAALEMAAAIVGATYPLTRGDEDWHSVWSAPPDSTWVGPYAVLEALRGEYPADATTHAGADARTIVAALRGHRGPVGDIVDLSGPYDSTVADAVMRAVEMIRAGAIIEPTTVEEEPDRELRQTELAQTMIEADMAIDALRSLQVPTFGA